MQRSVLVPIVGFAIVGLAAIVALLLTQSFLAGAGELVPDSTADTSAGPTASAGPSPTTGPSPSGEADAGTSPAGSSAPSVGPSSGATADPRLAFAEFVIRLADARDEAKLLLDRITAAAQDGDAATVRSTALEIDALVDRERGWLADHPPADCYAQAHSDTDAMYVAFGVAAGKAIAWAEADGLAAIGALVEALAAADAAIASTEVVAGSVGRVDCG